MTFTPEDFRLAANVILVMLVLAHPIDRLINRVLTWAGHLFDRRPRR